MMTWQERLARQADILGDGGMAVVRRTAVAVVGCGGNGSAFSLLAVLAGFGNFHLVDFDRLEESNLNRFMCGGTGDIGELKVDLVRRRLIEIDPETQCHCLPVDVRDKPAKAALAVAGVVVSAVDRNDARVFLQLECLRLGKPLLDLGSGGVVTGGRLRFLGSRASLYVPGGPCLFCQSLDEEDPFLSHISLVTANVIAAACGLQLLLSHLTGTGDACNSVFHDTLSHSLTPMKLRPRPGCPYCAGGKEGDG